MASQTLIINEAAWEWFGHPGHFICAHWCRYHLCTKVGDYLVSTVGEYWPERGVREIHAEAHDPEWLNKNRHLRGSAFDHAYMERFGFEEIGYKRKYETFVFKAGKRCDAVGCGCGMPCIDGDELDTLGANDAGTAHSNHIQLCREFAKKGVVSDGIPSVESR